MAIKNFLDSVKFDLSKMFLPRITANKNLAKGKENIGCAKKKKK